MEDDMPPLAYYTTPEKNTHDRNIPEDHKRLIQEYMNAHSGDNPSKGTYFAYWVDNGIVYRTEVDPKEYAMFQSNLKRLNTIRKGSNNNVHDALLLTTFREII